MEKSKFKLIISGLFLLLAIIFTILVATIDVGPAGPNLVTVGFSALNHDVATTFTFNDFWYQFTSGPVMIILFAVPLFYVALGFYQLMKRKSLKKVDRELFALAGFYVVVILTYLLFEKLFVINYRPVVLGAGPESSFPSSHTLFSLCLCGSAIIINQKLFAKNRWASAANIILLLFAITIVVGRFLSGVHWLTDIIGGIIISAALLVTFYSILSLGLFAKSPKSPEPTNSLKSPKNSPSPSPKEAKQQS